MPKLTIEKFKGDYTKINTFMDSFVAAIDSCEDLKEIEKFNYFHSYLEGETFHTIQGIRLTYKNYPEALEVLRRRYGNKQRIISAHMNKLLNIKKVERDRNVQGQHRLYDDTEYHVRSLRSLDVDDDNYRSLLTPIIMERLPYQFKLMISRQVGDDTWDLTQLLCVIQDEWKARENFLISDNLFKRSLQDSYKGGKKFVSTYTGVGLHVSQQAPKRACVFCRISAKL